MSTISIEYDNCSVSVKIIRTQGAEDYLYIDKHTDMETIANELYGLLDEVAGSFDVDMEEI